MIKTVQDLRVALAGLPADLLIGVDGEDWLYPIQSVTLAESLAGEHKPFAQITYDVTDDVLDEVYDNG